jgi:hypothetical protein
MVQRSVRLSATVAGAVSALASGGCYFASSGSAERLLANPVLPDPSVWPEVPVASLDEMLCAYPTLRPLRAVEEEAGLVGRDPIGIQGEADSPTSPLRLHRVGGMVVRLQVDREGRPLDTSGDLFSLFIGFSPNGYVQTGLAFGGVNERVDSLVNERERLTRAGNGEQSTPWCAPAVVVEGRAPYSEGVAFRVPSTLPDKPKGVILHLWALGSNPYEVEVMAAFARRGWVVIDVDPEDGVDVEMSESAVTRVLEIEDEVRRKRADTPGLTRAMTPEAWSAYRAHPVVREIAELEAESWRLRNPPVRLAGEADVEPTARLLSWLVDRTLANNALACEAILDTVHTLHPATKDLPVVVVGFSAGSLSTPAVVARLRDRVSAAVLVGSAANLVEVGARSTFYDGGLGLESRPLRPGEPESRADRPNKPTDDLVRKLGARYLELSRLDPYHTAAALRGMPVLMVQALWDTWVPSDLGDLLYERLGKPDRLLHTGGHGMLFYFLPGQAEWIIDWVERRVLLSGDDSIFGHSAEWCAFQGVRGCGDDREPIPGSGKDTR